MYSWLPPLESEIGEGTGGLIVQYINFCLIPNLWSEASAWFSLENKPPVSCREESWWCLVRWLWGLGRSNWSFYRFSTTFMVFSPTSHPGQSTCCVPTSLHLTVGQSGLLPSSSRELTTYHLLSGLYNCWNWPFTTLYFLLSLLIGTFLLLYFHLDSLGRRGVRCMWLIHIFLTRGVVSEDPGS